METNQQAKLGNVFEFNETDLIDNREGRLSTAQIGRLRARAIQRGAIAVIFIIFLGILSMASAGDGTDSDNFTFSFFIFLSIGVAVALTIGVAERHIAAGIVEKRSGQAHLRMAPHDYEPALDDTIWADRRVSSVSPYNLPMLQSQDAEQKLMPRHPGLYSLIISDQEFRLNEAQYNAMQRTSYTVYYLPRLNLIVSLESFVSVEPEPKAVITIAAPSTSNTLFTDDGDTIRG